MPTWYNLAPNKIQYTKNGWVFWELSCGSNACSRYLGGGYQCRRRWYDQWHPPQSTGISSSAGFWSISIESKSGIQQVKNKKLQCQGCGALHREVQCVLPNDQEAGSLFHLWSMHINACYKFLQVAIVLFSPKQPECLSRGPWLSNPNHCSVDGGGIS